MCSDFSMKIVNCTFLNICEYLTIYIYVLILLHLLDLASYFIICYSYIFLQLQLHSKLYKNFQQEKDEMMAKQ